MSAERLFGLKEMCSSCPWRNDGGAIDLQPGRLRGICDDLLADDGVPFICHKTSSGERGEGEDGNESRYVSSGKERYCLGAMGYLQREGRPNQAMRLGAAFGLLNREAVDRAIPHIKADEAID